MSNLPAIKQDAEIIESVLIGGDLSRLTPPQRVSYYKAVCDSVGLNPLTKPFEYITLNGKLVLYAKRDATDQLRKTNGVSIQKIERERVDGIWTVTAYATDKTGRQDSSIGAVNVEGLKGDAMANAIMKAETKAKRRVTLSICGLGMLDETEIETIPNVRYAPVEPIRVESIVPTQVEPVIPSEDEITSELVGDNVDGHKSANLNGNGHEPEADKPIVYESPVAIYGKVRLPSAWVKELTKMWPGDNQYHIANVVKNLRLPQATDAADVVAKVAEHLAAKA